MSAEQDHADREFRDYVNQNIPIAPCPFCNSAHDAALAEANKEIAALKEANHAANQLIEAAANEAQAMVQAKDKEIERLNLLLKKNQCQVVLSLCDDVLTKDARITSLSAQLETAQAKSLAEVIDLRHEVAAKNLTISELKAELETAQGQFGIDRR